mmetsp:Transcript_107027/g.207422  ORF Transcript_107027/g.207422 Transcript_107027/m.207422 type:complete len:80 (-) Transcript_107027:44-283(-)
MGMDLDRLLSGPVRCKAVDNYDLRVILNHQAFLVNLALLAKVERVQICCCYGWDTRLLRECMYRHILETRTSLLCSNRA